MAPRRRCLTCGSRQWHKEPSSGLIACSEGHILQDYRNETTEITEAGPHAMKKRAIKSRKRHAGLQSKADPKLYHGARARYHYFLCLQLILRTQIQTLVRLWDLPPEFEIVCRDLWALHLSLLPDPPPAEPYLHHHPHAQDNLSSGDAREKDGSPVDPRAANEESGSSLAQDGSENDDDDVPGADDGDEPGGSGEENDPGKQAAPPDGDAPQYENDTDEEEDPELDALMRENSDVSTSSEDDEEDTAPQARTKPRRRKGHAAAESAASTVAVLLVGCWMLRIPVMIRDFTRLIESYELPYLDPVVRILPMSMVQHLTKSSVQALSPPHAPGTMAVGGLASRLAKKLGKTYDIQAPEYNAAGTLWRLTKEMGGTPMVYRLAKRVASVLSVPLTLNTASGAEQHYDTAPPEVGLLACIMIVLKMVYGLDGNERAPKDADDVACALPRTSEYLGAIKKMGREDLQEKEAKFSARNILQVGDMKEQELDEYIQFCGKVLVGQGTESGLERYFPMSEIVESAEEEARTREGAGYQGMEATDDGVRPGESYKIWNARDVDGTVPEEYSTVVSRGAAIVGVGSERIGEVLAKYERRLLHWISLKNRRARE